MPRPPWMTPTFTVDGPSTGSVGRRSAPMSASSAAIGRIAGAVRLPVTADIEAGVRMINAFMEDRIRERPEEWFWVHRRWPNEVYAALLAGEIPTN